MHGNVAYIAYPIFGMYQAMGQPLYKYIVRGLLDRLLPDPALDNRPAIGRPRHAHPAGRAEAGTSCICSTVRRRCAASACRSTTARTRVMEMIEDIPAIGPVSARVRLPQAPARVYDALTGEDVAWKRRDDGAVEVTVPRLHIHAAVVFEGTP